MLRASKRSAVWKISSGGTPYFLQAFWKAAMFSISWKLLPFVAMRLTLPGWITLINLQNATSLRVFGKSWSRHIGERITVTGDPAGRWWAPNTDKCTTMPSEKWPCSMGWTTTWLSGVDAGLWFSFCGLHPSMEVHRMPWKLPKRRMASTGRKFKLYAHSNVDSLKPYCQRILKWIGITLAVNHRSTPCKTKESSCWRIIFRWVCNVSCVKRNLVYLVGGKPGWEPESEPEPVCLFNTQNHSRVCGVSFSFDISRCFYFWGSANLFWRKLRRFLYAGRRFGIFVKLQASFVKLCDILWFTDWNEVVLDSILPICVPQKTP